MTGWEVCCPFCVKKHTSVSLTKSLSGQSLSGHPPFSFYSMPPWWSPDQDGTEQFWFGGPVRYRAPIGCELKLAPALIFFTIFFSLAPPSVMILLVWWSPSRQFLKQFMQNWRISVPLTLYHLTFFLLNIDHNVILPDQIFLSTPPLAVVWGWRHPPHCPWPCPPHRNAVAAPRRAGKRSCLARAESPSPWVFYPLPTPEALKTDVAGRAGPSDTYKTTVHKRQPP